MSLSEANEACHAKAKAQKTEFAKTALKAFAVFLLALAADQSLKVAFLVKFEFGIPFWHSEWVDLVLVQNRGVAFSMFAFFGEMLKFLQLGLIAAIVVFLVVERKILTQNAVACGLVLGGGASNLLDRFLHGFVVDYVAWHKWFEFAVFNLADVLIDLGVVLIILVAWRQSRQNCKNQI